MLKNTEVFFVRDLQIKRNLEHLHIVDKNKIMDMWLVLLWYFLSSIWMHVEIWSIVETSMHKTNVTYQFRIL